MRAFANLRRAARDGAELYCFVWRSPAENPFMTVAERAAAPLLPTLPARDPKGPGQFAFADPLPLFPTPPSLGYRRMGRRVPSPVFMRAAQRKRPFQVDAGMKGAPKTWSR